MAKKKNGVNKSLEIREYYSANPKAKPLEVVAAMKEKGIDVNAQFVSTVKSNAKKKKTVRRSAPAATASKKAAPAKKPGRKPGRKPAAAKTAGGEVSFDSLIKAKQLIEEMGGVDNARTALSAYEQLVG
ncbi:hypothetical protein [Neorhodopirellula pilleata]|uniref:Uncharacterized protein n=1 Tax=Neorhodopirellula pilleata TaxID=2714738 RepID=A0A5C5ZIT7_9BACT|nr:hypothetical protein [Neorhodopirellula pilleata]TWT86453.1 hypothetical protein Pla100_60240 [Neorhodopirellula pilleata]